MKQLESKVAIITGAASGIGKSTAELIAEEGAMVVVSDINEEQGIGVSDQINQHGGKSIFVRADIALPEENKKLVQETIRAFGALDIAVNNAGIAGPRALTAEYPIDGWQKVINVNLSGVFYGMHYQIPEMLAKGGSIINISSIMGVVATILSPAYIASKHGLIGLTKAAALEYAGKGIRINAVGPAYIKTPMVTNALDAASLEKGVALHPIGRLGEPREVAELILWLASSKSSFVTGSYYAIDGGYLAQ